MAQDGWTSTAARPTARRVGVIGLGVMGKPIARNLVSAGYQVVVYNRSHAAVDELVAEGAERAASVAGLVRCVEVVITVLPASRDVEQVALGDGGVIAEAHPGMLLIDMSTIAPRVSQEVARRAKQQGMEAVDAPMSGGEGAAIAGTLSVMCGGSVEGFTRALPVLEAVAHAVIHVGASGAGQVVKACNQMIVASTLASMGEALVLGAKAGVAPEALVEAVRGGAARCWALDVRAPAVLKRDFTPGFRSALHHKDLTIALETATDLGVPIPVASCVRELYGALKARGDGDLDHAGVIRVIELLAGFEVNGRAPTQPTGNTSAPPSPHGRLESPDVAATGPALHTEEVPPQ